MLGPSLRMRKKLEYPHPWGPGGLSAGAMVYGRSRHE